MGRNERCPTDFGWLKGLQSFDGFVGKVKEHHDIGAEVITETESPQKPKIYEVPQPGDYMAP